RGDRGDCVAADGGGDDVSSEAGEGVVGFASRTVVRTANPTRPGLFKCLLRQGPIMLIGEGAFAGRLIMSPIARRQIRDDLDLIERFAQSYRERFGTAIAE